MKLLEEYFALQEKIHSHFGYKEDWVAIPLDDQTSRYWMLMQRPDGGGKVVYSDVPITEAVMLAGDEIYSAQIYTQRFLPKWVYRAEDYTMVCADTRCDGNKFLMIFDNQKEYSGCDLTEIYNRRWAI